MLYEFDGYKYKLLLFMLNQNKDVYCGYWTQKICLLLYFSVSTYICLIAIPVFETKKINIFLIELIQQVDTDYPKLLISKYSLLARDIS